MNTLLALLAAAALVSVLMPRLNPSSIPTPQDEALRMETAGTTITVSSNGTTKNLGKNFRPGGIGQPSCVVLDVTALDLANANETYAAVLQESADGGTTWTDTGAAVAITAPGVLAVAGFISQENVRCKLTLAGTTPSITYGAWFNPMSA